MLCLTFYSTITVYFTGILQLTVLRKRLCQILYLHNCLQKTTARFTRVYKEGSMISYSSFCRGLQA